MTESLGDQYQVAMCHNLVDPEHIQRTGYYPPSLRGHDRLVPVLGDNKDFHHSHCLELLFYKLHESQCFVTYQTNWPFQALTSIVVNLLVVLDDEIELGIIWIADKNILGLSFGTAVLVEVIVCPFP